MSALLSVQKCDMVLCYAVNFNIYLYKLTIIVFIKKNMRIHQPGIKLNKKKIESVSSMTTESSICSCIND